MIMTSDIADILYRDCQQFGISAIYRKGNVPEVTGGKLTAERIVILPKPQQPGKQWLKDFVEVNLCVPDLDDKGTADLGWSAWRSPPLTTRRACSTALAIITR